MRLVKDKLEVIKDNLLRIQGELQGPVHISVVKRLIEIKAGMDPNTVKKYMDHLRNNKIIIPEGVDSFKIK